MQEIIKAGIAEITLYNEELDRQRRRLSSAKSNL
jgi:hypothetical protein